MDRVYTYKEMMELVRKAYDDAADSLRPWVFMGPHTKIEKRRDEALEKMGSRTIER